MGYRLGVDLGTTFTAAAVRKDGVSRMASLGMRQPEMPSVVSVGDEIRIGDAAEFHGRADPASVARSFKRRFADSTPLVVKGQPWSAEALTTRVLRHVLDQVGQAEGAPPDHVVLTHPAGWREFRLDAMHATAEMAEAGSHHLVPEPVAAARHYAESNELPADARLVVFDFGGGTFDTSVVAVSNGQFEVIGSPQGIERLGGIDIDEAVFAHACAVAGLDPYELDETPEIMRDMHRLRLECRDAKEFLSSATVASITVRAGGVDTNVQLTRATFESMLTPMLADAGATVGRAIRMAGLGTDEIDALLLVGGTSRIPAVGAALSEQFGRPILMDTHPKHAIALGAVLSDPPAATRLEPPHPGQRAQAAVTPEGNQTVAEHAPSATPPIPPLPLPAPAVQPVPAPPNRPIPAAGGVATVGQAKTSRAPIILVLIGIAALIFGGLAFALLSNRTDPNDTATSSPTVAAPPTTVPASDTTSPSPETTAVASQTTEPAPETSVPPDDDADLVVVPAGEPIQIRLFGDTTGGFDEIGGMSVSLSQQAIADFGPVNGFEVSTGTVIDTACTEERGAAAASTVAGESDVIGVIGPQCSISVLGASETVTDAGMTIIATAGGWPTLTSNLDGVAAVDQHDGFYRLIHSDLAHSLAMADYATVELGLSRAAVVHVGIPYELEVIDAFNRRFEAQGGEVVVTANVAPSQVAPADLAQIFIDADVDFVYLSLGSSDADLVLTALDGQGDWVVGGLQWLFIDEFLAAEHTQDVLFTLVSTVVRSNVNETTGRSGDDVVTQFEAASGTTAVNDVWARGYDAAVLLLAAIEASSTVEGGDLIIDRAGVRAYLDGVTDYAGVSGPITCDAFGDCARSPVVVVQNLEAGNMDALAIVYEFDDFG